MIAFEKTAVAVWLTEDSKEHEDESGKDGKDQ